MGPAVDLFLSEQGWVRSRALCGLCLHTFAGLHPAPSLVFCCPPSLYLSLRPSSFPFLPSVFFFLPSFCRRKTTVLLFRVLGIELKSSVCQQALLPPIPTLSTLSYLAGPNFCYPETGSQLGVVAHTSDPSTQGFEAILVYLYIESNRTVRATK